MNSTTGRAGWEESQNAKRINSEGAEFGLPEADEVIWRYLTFARFEQLLATKSLYLARIDRFWDFREGSSTDASVANAAAGVSKVVFSPDGRTIERQAVSKEDGAWAAGLAASIGYMSTRNAYHAICWNKGVCESSLMWRSYGAPPAGDQHQFRVAIKTRADRLVDALDLSQIEGQVFFGPVTYKDYDVETSTDQNINTNVFQKKQEYKAENEVRLAIFNPAYLPSGYPIQFPDSPGGEQIPIEINNLIEEIYIEAVPVLDMDPVVIEEETESRLQLVKTALGNAGLGDVKIISSEIL